MASSNNVNRKKNKCSQHTIDITQLSLKKRNGFVLQLFFNPSTNDPYAKQLRL